MIDRLSSWIVAALVLTALPAVLLVGVQPAALLFLLHVPAVLAYLLLVRAAWRALHRRPWDLQVRGRMRLGGAAGVLVPLLFLVLWGVGRETGFVRAQLTVKRADHQTSSRWQDWADRVPATPIQHTGLAVTAPAGALGDAFRAALRHHWSAGDGSQLHGTVALACEPPFAGWPLWKSEEVGCRVAIELQMRKADVEVARCTTIDMQVQGTWTAIGTMSRRDFHEWLGDDLGEKVRDTIAQRVRKLHDPK